MGYSGQTEYHDLARSAQTQKGLSERCPERIPDGMIVLALSLSPGRGGGGESEGRRILMCDLNLIDFLLRL